MKACIAIAAAALTLTACGSWPRTAVITQTPYSYSTCCSAVSTPDPGAALPAYTPPDGSALGQTPAATETPAPTPAPTSAATAPPTPTPPPPPQYATFTDGAWQVGADIQAGTYRLRQASPGCYWERDKDLNGTVDSILANEHTDYPAVVTILGTDKAFQSTNCGEWTTDLSRITASMTSFGDGDFIVGTDIAPGTYRSTAQAGCYWERDKDFLHNGAYSIIANDNTDNSALVQISPGDKMFESKGCGPWSRA